MNNNIHVIENFLTGKECNKFIIKYKSELNLIPGKVANIGISVGRKSSIGFIDHIKELDNRLKKTLKNTIKVKGYEVTNLSRYQFTEYVENEYYDWHTDSSDEVYKERYCSVVIILNSDYDGGYLQFKDDEGNLITPNVNTGTLLIFYSNTPHRVTPIIKGIRYSLVNWVSLKASGGFKKTLI